MARLDSPNAPIRLFERFKRGIGVVAFFALLAGASWIVAAVVILALDHVVGTRWYQGGLGPIFPAAFIMAYCAGHRPILRMLGKLASIPDEGQ